MRTQDTQEDPSKSSFLETEGGRRFNDIGYEEEVSLLDYWRVLYRWKWLIIILGIVATGTSGFVTYQMPKIYKSTTTILPLGNEGSGGLGAALSAIPFASALGGVAGINTPADQVLIILNSRTMAEKIIQEFKLQPHYHQKAWDPEKNNWRPDKKKPFLEDTIKKFQNNISAKSDRHGGVSLSVLDEDPMIAANIANAMVSALAKFLNDHSLSINFQTIDPAVPPERKFKPSLRVNVLIAGVLALFIGIFFAFFIEYIRRVRQAERQVRGEGSGVMGKE
ncbi:MAG TPA: Wzz/FepE/Etk N-terminal domain-containing protein [Nitrospiria bacterium]|jgi:uncharacterized protein involved in exopolysaccharide biosynthesis